MKRWDELEIPPGLRWFLKARKTAVHRSREEIVIGGDSETLEGKPLSFQFYSEDINLEEIIWPRPAEADKRFFAFLNKLPKGENYAIYFHNLKFDLVELFYPIWQYLPMEIEFAYGDWQITGVYQAPSFLTLRNQATGTMVALRDSMSWFIGSLDNAAAMVCPDLPKLEQPQGLGSKRFKKGDSIYEAYAMRDAEVCYHLGCAIREMHREFDIPLTVSLASMSSAIFRKHFQTYDIPQPQIECIKGAYESYHGGKNNIVAGVAPAWHSNMASLDVSSAYPYAMSKMPAFSNLKAYKEFRQRKPGRWRVPPWGVYQVTGIMEKSSPWPVLFEHDFTPIRSGYVNAVWVHGLELNRAFETKQFRPTEKITGYYYDVDMERRNPALAEFVHTFYEKKQASKKAGQEMRAYTYKIILNSLYGKFIQRREVDVSDDPNEPQKILVAGGLFHPFIASGITAHTRAYMNRLEHRFSAIHTATDGIYTHNTPTLEAEVQASNKAENVGIDNDLGVLEYEGVGDLLLLRNKLYVLYTNEQTSQPSTFENRYVLKAATHGFQGSIAQLEELVRTGKREYQVTKPNTLKESQRRGLEVNRFETRTLTLNVDQLR